MGDPIESYIRKFVKEAVQSVNGLIQEEASKDARSKLVIANWKMNKTLAEAVQFISNLNVSNEVQIGICPPTQLLYPLHTYLKTSSKSVGLGAQNVHWEDSGAYTGEVSADMLLDVGCQFTIVGHSERRQYAGETDREIGLKVQKATSRGLTPIICIGETLKQKETCLTEAVLGEQLAGALGSVQSDQIVIAYEPVWAIGTGRSATAEYAQDTHVFIREKITHYIGEAARRTPILYGGSVNAKNVLAFASMPDIDGALVGGASLENASFDEITRAFAKGD
jgi:triosephosphate isomerase (TIM)